MVNILRRKAVVVTLAVAALSIAGGGVAIAQPAAKAPAEVAQTPVRQPRPDGQPPATGESARKARAAAASVGTLATAPGTVSFAVVRADGTLARSSGGVTSLRFSVALYGPGQYQVSFPYNVSTKAFVATIGDAGPGYVPPGGEVSVAPRTEPLTNSVFVQTRDSDGDPANLPFHLVIAN